MVTVICPCSSKLYSTRAISGLENASSDASYSAGCFNIAADTGVHGCSFDLRAGEILGIAGLIGTGRTELVRALFGADDKTAGTVKIHGERVPVVAEVIQLDIFSAHADQAGLLDWLRRCDTTPRGVFVTHGEAVPADVLRLEIKDQLGYRVEVPEYRETVDLR